MTEKLVPKAELATESEKAARYEGGRVEYSVLGEMTDHKPIILVPGFTIGRLVQRDFATTLHEEGDRQVIFSEQPEFSWKPSMKPVLDRHAEALLAVIEKEGLGNQPVDFITHSFGSIIFTRAAELAKEHGITSFDSENGSRAVFIAAAGTNEKENLIKLGHRFARFMVKGVPYGKELDPNGEWMKAGTKNFIKRPIKTAKEVNILRKKENIYTKLGQMGIKPSFIGFNSDELMPFGASESVIMNEELELGGYSVPINPKSRPLAGATKDLDFKGYMSLTGLDKKESVKEWARHHVGAGHNDLLFNPYRAVSAILPILDGDMLERSKMASEKYLEKKSSPAKKTSRIVL